MQYMISYEYVAHHPAHIVCVARVNRVTHSRHVRRHTAYTQLCATTHTAAPYMPRLYFLRHTHILTNTLHTCTSTGSDTCIFCHPFLVTTHSLPLLQIPSRSGTRQRGFDQKERNVLQNFGKQLCTIKEIDSHQER